MNAENPENQPRLESVPEIEEHFELSEKDEADLRSLQEQTPPEYHSLLEIFRATLEPAAAEAGKKVAPQWATRIVAGYTGVTFADMNTFRDMWLGRIGQLKDILDYEISQDPDALKVSTPQDDAVENAHHYKNLLLLWQKQILQWELDWDTTADDAAIQLATMSEVYRMFFGETGLTAHLDTIGFEFTEADSEWLAGELDAMKEAS